MKREPFEQNPSYLPPKDGEPPLHRAARVGDDDAIRKLVTEGADVNQLFDMRLDPDGRQAVATPLMVAAGSGYGASIGTMQRLLELGANASLKTGFGSIARMTFSTHAGSRKCWPKRFRESNRGARRERRAMFLGLARRAGPSGPAACGTA